MFALTQGLRRAVQTRPGGIATSFAGRRRTWRESADRVSRVAGALSALGVRSGDRVAILALNSDRYLELMYAIPWLGAAMVPINTRLAAPEIEYILNDSGAVALFIDTGMAHHLSALEDRTPALREVIWLDDLPGPEGILRYEDLTNYEAIDDAGARNDDLAGLFYTGGTTGRSKGVVLTHTNLVVNALNGVAGMGFTADTAYLHSGAMFHLADGASTFGVTLSGLRLPGATSGRDIALSVANVAELDDIVLDLVLGLLEAQARQAGGAVQAFARLIGLSSSKRTPARRPSSCRWPAARRTPRTPSRRGRACTPRAKAPGPPPASAPPARPGSRTPGTTSGASRSHLRRTPGSAIAPPARSRLPPSARPAPAPPKAAAASPGQSKGRGFAPGTVPARCPAAPPPPPRSPPARACHRGGGQGGLRGS